MNVPAAATKSQVDGRTSRSQQRIDEWSVRPASLADQNAVDHLLERCYSTLMPAYYDADFCQKVLPHLIKARPELLTCPTWYVVEHPHTSELVGCGGWSREIPWPKEVHQKTAGCPHLRHFATHPDFTRCGVGRAIWQRILEDVAKELAL